MQKNNAAIIVSVIVIALIAIGVWWFYGGQGASSATPAQPGTPVSGQLQGTVQ